MKFGQLINSLIVMLAALSLGAWSFVAHPSDLAKANEEWSFESGLAFDELVNSTEALSVVRNGRDAVTLMPDSSATLKWDESTSHIDVYLSAGGVLFATQANDFSVSVHTSTVRVDSQESFAYVELDEEAKVTVYGLSHASLLSFVENETVLNALFVPDGMMIEVPASKVSSTLSRLRLTKLSKEFRAKEWTDDILNETVAALWSESKLRYTEQSVAFTQDLQADVNFGPTDSGVGAKAYGLYDGFRDLATVLPTAEVRLEKSKKDNMLKFAMSHLLFGDAERGLSWVNAWKSQDHSLEEIEYLYSSLFFVLPGDELYAVKTAAISLAFNQDASLSSLRRQFLEIESLIGRGEAVEAQAAFQDYQKNLSEALESGAFDDPSHLADLNREYLLVELLLRENADFYNVEYLKLLADMEAKILALAGGDTDLDEERQAFVLSKIQFLTKLFEFVVDRRVSVDDATDLANELLFTAEAYLALIPSNVAIRDWYESELEKADLAIAFINAPEFYSYSDFEEGLQAYVAKQQDLEDLQAYIQEIRSGNDSGVIAELSLDEAEAQVREVFNYNAISYSRLESQGDAAYRLFTVVGGKVDQYSFVANYDREGELLYDLVIEDQVRFSTGILLKDLRSVIEQALTETPLDAPEDEEPVASDASMTDSLALTQVVNAFEAAGYEADEFQFKILDREAGRFEFAGVITRYELSVQGQFDLESGRVLETTWDFEGKDQSLPDMALTQMESAVQAVYEALSK